MLGTAERGIQSDCARADRDPSPGATVATSVSDHGATDVTEIQPG